jgi:hypothetical protein
VSPRSLVKPLPHRFTIAPTLGGRAVCSLLHSSVGLPRLAVSQPAVLWCSDFPLATLCARAITRSASATSGKHYSMYQFSVFLTASDFVVARPDNEFSVLAKQKGQKSAKRTKKESFCCFCTFLPFLLP